MVVINLQQTEHDGMATLRIFGETDQVFEALLTEMAIDIPSVVPQHIFTPDQQGRVLVPYDSNGKRSEDKRMWWDLRPGAAIKLSKGHNIVGSGQPSYQPIRRGVGFVTCWRTKTMGIHLEIDGVPMTLGQWWIEAALRGGPKSLPVVNVEPEIAD